MRVHAIEGRSFGDRVDVAMETLTVALGESTSESLCSTLRRWLYELTGEVP